MPTPIRPAIAVHSAAPVFARLEQNFLACIPPERERAENVLRAFGVRWQGPFLGHLSGGRLAWGRFGAVPCLDVVIWHLEGRDVLLLDAAGHVDRREEC